MLVAQMDPGRGMGADYHPYLFIPAVELPVVLDSVVVLLGQDLFKGNEGSGLRKVLRPRPVVVGTGLRGGFPRVQRNPRRHAEWGGTVG